jgi:hypothetical protein
MSHVTDICILSAGYNPEVEAELKAIGFVDVHQHGGGNKACQGDVWLMSVNYLDSDDRWATPHINEHLYGNGEFNLYQLIQGLSWHRAEGQYHTKDIPLMFVKHEDDDNWSPWNPSVQR